MILTPVSSNKSFFTFKMDMESEAVEKPDNLIWIEQVLINHMEQFYDPTMSDQQDAVVSSNSGNGEKEKHELKLTVAEIEMRDENYFGDDRMSTLSRLVAARIKFVIEGEEEERSHFWIIKIPSILAQERELAAAFNAYKREISFYTEILPAMKLWVESQYIDELIEFKVPPCFYGKFLRANDANPDMELLDHILEAESLLVLEDMRASEFGKSYFGKGMEIPEVFATIFEICKFHAVSYVMQEKTKESLRWKELLSPQDFVKFYCNLFGRGFEIFKNFLSNRPNEPNADKIVEAMTNLSIKSRDILTSLMVPSVLMPSTLIHLDLWSDNLLFRVKESDLGCPLSEADLDCVILDWQMVSLGRPSHDLALLVLLSMDADLRRESSHLILQYYYLVFEKTIGYFGIEEMPFSFANLVSEFSNSCILAIMMAISSMDVVLMEENAQTRLLDAIKDIMDDGLLDVQFIHELKETYIN